MQSRIVSIANENHSHLTYINSPVPRAAPALMAVVATLTMLAAFLRPARTPYPIGVPDLPEAVPVFVRPVAALKRAQVPAPGPALLPAADPQAAPLQLPRADPRRPSEQAPGWTGDGPAHTRPPRLDPAAAGEAQAHAPPTASITPPLPPPARAASAALRLDRAVVREASRASRSAVQQMADASGRPAGDAPAGAEQRLADSVARTLQPDCMPPGGTHGLLTPFVAAYKIATDQCRHR